MNKVGKLQGRGVNAHLNAAGLDQAQGLGRFVRNVPFDTVTSSSLYRAHEVGVGEEVGRQSSAGFTGDSEGSIISQAVVDVTRAIASFRFPSC